MPIQVDFLLLFEVTAIPIFYSSPGCYKNMLQCSGNTTLVVRNEKKTKRD